MTITNLADIAVAPISGLASAIAVPVVTRAGAVPIARINAVALNTAQDALSCEELRQRACTELLRQAAQDAGLLISRKAHGAHHRAPFEGNYAIVSGVWNEVLDAGGDDSFFRTVERAVASATGVEPRCWHDPEDYDFFPPEEVEQAAEA